MFAGLQAHLLQQDLSRRLANGCIEPLMLEDGKGALLNMRGSFVLQRQHFVNLSLKDYVGLCRVSLHLWLPMSHIQYSPIQAHSIILDPFQSIMEKKQACIHKGVSKYPCLTARAMCHGCHQAPLPSLFSTQNSQYYSP